jgi:tRNA G18 (ribose-2'-O)-methylase SpoU
MGECTRVHDPRDARLADYVNLRDVELRKSFEAEHGLFLAEGEKVIRRALRSGLTPRSFLLTPRWLDGLRAEMETSPAPCFVVDESVAQQLTGFHVHRGALASMERRPLPSVPSALATARRVIVLEDVVDPTNVGAIFRSAAALGIDALLLSPRCADPLYRRSVKVAMGAVFELPYARLEDWYDGLNHIRSLGLEVLALTPHPGAEPLEAVAAELDRVALVFGAEGAGLSRRWLDTADRHVSIGMSRGVDSLNVAACAAVVCYVLCAGNSRNQHETQPGDDPP